MSKVVNYRSIEDALSDIPLPTQDSQSWQVRFGDFEVDQRKVWIDVDGLETSVKLDKVGANGKSGAVIKYQGDELATWTIRMKASSREGYNLMLAICKFCRAAPRKTGVQAHHPILEAADLSAFVTEKVKWPTANGAKEYIAELSCIEWAPEQKSGAGSVSKKIDVADQPTIYNGPKDEPPVAPTAAPPP